MNYIKSRMQSSILRIVTASSTSMKIITLCYNLPSACNIVNLFKYLLHTYYVPGIALRTKNTAMKKKKRTKIHDILVYQTL